MIRQTLKGARIYDLLDTRTFLALNQEPARIEQELSSQDRLVVIDEIQLLPVLLNEVHRLIEERGIRFLLTGSSARKLRRGGINLLGGRARTKYLHPFTRRELGSRFNLSQAMARGLLPSIYFHAPIFRLIRERISSKKLSRGKGPQYTGFQPFSAGCRLLQRHDRQLYQCGQ